MTRVEREEAAIQRARVAARELERILTELKLYRNRHDQHQRPEL